MKEKDFLGLGEQSSCALEKENRCIRLDAAYSIGSNSRRPFANKNSAMEKFISFENRQDDKNRMLLLNRLSSTDLQHIPSLVAFKAAQKVYSPLSSQKPLDAERHGAMQFSIHTCQNQGMNTNLAFAHHLNNTKFSALTYPHFPITLSSLNGLHPPATEVKQEPFGSVMASQAFVKNLTPRNVKKASTNEQLTIFYGGSVNVYDNVTLDKAQAIMQMASRDSNTSVNSSNPSNGASVLPLSKDLVFDGQNATQTLNSTERNVSEDKGSEITIGARISSSHNEPSKVIHASMGADTAAIIMSKAMPQARKASLARFLEKRKERISSIMPYSSTKNLSENTISVKGSAPSSNCSSTDISMPGNQEGTWRAGQTKSCSDGDGSLSTKLEI